MYSEASGSPNSVSLGSATYSGADGEVFREIVNADNGNIITTLPTGMGVDTVAFNPATMEAMSAEGGGSMTFIKENSPTSFAVEQTLQTMLGAKTLALDTKTNHLLTMTAEWGPPSPMRSRDQEDALPVVSPMVAGSFSILMVGK
jgi:hypothetical protein